MSKLRKDIPCLEVHTVDDGHKTIFYYAGHWWLAYLVTHLPVNVGKLDVPGPAFLIFVCAHNARLPSVV